MHRIIERRDGGRRLCILDDGYDYAALLDAYRRGVIVGTTPPSGSRKSTSARLEQDGRLFFVKADVRAYRGWCNRLGLRLFGTPYLSTMRRVTRAVDAGFDRIQRMYLVEETIARDPATGVLTVTAWLVLEYIPGEYLADRMELIPQVPAVLRELHAHGLAQSDPHTHNFVVSEGRLKVIDLLFFNQPLIFVWPRDVIKVEDRWGIPFPLDGFFDRLVYRAMRVKMRIRKFFRK